MCASTARASTSPTTQPIKLERQAKRHAGAAAERLQGSDRHPRSRRIRLRQSRAWPKSRSSSSSAQEIPRRGHRRPRRLGASSAAQSTSASPASATTPTPAAQPTWASSLTCFPATFPSPRPAPSPNTPTCPPLPGKTLPRDVRRSRPRASWAHCSSSAPIRFRALGSNPAAFKNTFLIVQDHLPHRDRRPRRRGFPRRQSLREIRHRHQHLRRRATGKQGRRSRRRQAGLRNPRSPRRRHGRTTSRRSFPSATQASRPTSASRAARSPAKPTVMRSGLRPMDLEPKLSPFDPFAVLDEIERLVPGYAIDRINLFAGNDVHSEPASPGFVPVTVSRRRRSHRSRARHALHLRHAGPLQPSAQATGRTPGTGTGRNRSRLKVVGVPS